jgi:hypothetical protein
VPINGPCSPRSLSIERQDRLLDLSADKATVTAELHAGKDAAPRVVLYGRGRHLQETRNLLGGHELLKHAAARAAAIRISEDPACGHA